MDPLAEPIGRLNTQLNAALIQIGRIFRDANRADSKAFGRARGQDEKMTLISKANTRFHEALDEIEIEIVQAKSVMERDLNRIRQAREVSNHAQDQVKQGQPDTHATMLPDALAAGAMDLSADAFADTNLLDQIQGIEAANPTDLAPAAAPEVSSTDATAAAAATSDNTKATTTDASSALQNAQVTIPQTDAAADPNTGFDFDSMFDDAGTSNAFDLDFSGSSAADGAATNATANPENLDDLFNLGTGGDDFTDLGAAMNGTDGQNAEGSGTAEELESLLPGLGSYVNVEGGNAVNDDDFAMIDIPTDGLDLANMGHNQDQHPNKDGATSNTNTSQNAVETNADGQNATGGDDSGDQNAGGPLDGMDDIFGDVLDVGDPNNTSLDDFDWGI